MVHTTRRWLGYWVAQFHFHRERSPVVAFTTAVSSAQSVLVVLPYDRQPSAPVQAFVDLLRERFQPENITVVLNEQQHEISRLLPRSHVLRITEADLTPLFLPRASAVQELRTRSHDIAIDLNLDFVIPSGYICRESGSRVRIGFARPRADLFFNFQVQRNSSLPRERVYERLAQCLQMF